MNVPVYETFTITNNWPVKATYNFANFYNLSAEALISIYPPSGEIEKYKSVTINVGCVAYNKVKIREIFVLTMQGAPGKKFSLMRIQRFFVVKDERPFSEKFFVPCSLDSEEPDPNGLKYWEVDLNMVDTLK